MDKNIYDGFTVNIFLDEDGDYLAHFVEMPNISAFSDSPEGALLELATAWKGVKESYKKHNEPIPKAPHRKAYENLRTVPIDEKLFNTLTDEATKAGISLPQLVRQMLESTIYLVKEGRE